MIGKRTLVLCVADCHYGAEWIVRGLRGEILNRYGGKPGALAMVLEAGYGRRCIYPISL